MAIKKIEIRPKGTGDYADILYPKTSTDMVVDTSTGQTVSAHMADKARHISASCETITDWNQANRNGYFMGFNAANSPYPQPNAIWFYGTVVQHNQYWFSQRVIAFTGRPLKEEYVRHCNEGTFSNWERVTIGNLASLQTTNSDSVVGAINELFTLANNGKTAVANAVSAKGVPASPSDTFPTLASKVGQISTGKKYAEGSVVFQSSSTKPKKSGFLYSDTNRTPVSGSIPYLEITTLDFNPTLIWIYASGGMRYIFDKESLNCWVRINPLNQVSVSSYSQTSTITFYEWQSGSGYVSNNGFCAPMHGSLSSGFDMYQWRAWGA